LVAIKVVDADNQPVVNQKVSLNGQSSTTDQTGIASFTNIAAGSYEVTVTTKNGKTLASIIVAENSSVSDVQLFEVNLKNKKSTLLYALIPLILITVFIIIWISSRHRSKNELDRHFPLKQTDPNPKASSAIGRIAGGKIYDAGETIQPNVEPKKTETPEVNK
jgi:hypothetical protein